MCYVNLCFSTTVRARSRARSHVWWTVDSGQWTVVSLNITSINNDTNEHENKKKITEMYNFCVVLSC